MDTDQYRAIIKLIKDNWDEFVSIVKEEDEAERIIDLLEENCTW